ncbi:MAG TPA: TlpA disulfide reductase family protein [Mucilaginibacter sp.]|nr:TlpA disulfide reductase family protein [Mucilaginibacter sp.]
MIRSKLFWLGAILLAIIPLLVLDIPRHYIDWRRDVRDERFYISKNTYNYTAQQKKEIADEVQKSDRELKALMYTKGLASLLLFVAGVYFMLKYFKIENSSWWKALTTCLLLMILTTSAKLFSWTTYGGSRDIKLLQLSPTNTSLSDIHNENFKGKVVYVDFWGTTCAPCLEEFRNFTKPLKQHYKNQPDLAYLYICGGTRLMWKQQLQKFDLEGSHIFLDKTEYAALYHRSVSGAKDTIVSIPRYLIIDKQGKIVDKDAPQPSDVDSVEKRLDKYLALK